MIIEILGTAIDTDNISYITEIREIYRNSVPSKTYQIREEFVTIEPGFIFEVHLKFGNSVHPILENEHYDKDLFFIKDYFKSNAAHKEKTPEDLLKVQNFIKDDLERMRRNILIYWTREQHDYYNGGFKVPQINYIRNLRPEEKSPAPPTLPPKILSEIKDQC